MSIKTKLKQLLWPYKQYKYTITNTLIRLGILKGGNNYQKFIVVSRSRTGSTLIDHSLRQLPHVDSDGEIFNRILGRDEKWLVNNFFSSKREAILAAGFKIFYYHPNDAKTTEVWKYLLELKDLKIIHLKRKNILAAHVSKRFSEQNNLWSVKKNEKLVKSNQKISLSVEDCSSAFRDTKNYEKEFDLLFENHELIEIFYEDLKDDYLGTMDEIFQFLNLPHAKVEPPLVKQSKRDLSEKVANYDKLKSHFKNTEWHEFFD